MRTAPVAALLLCLLAAGCGSERAEPPDLSRSFTPEAFQPYLDPSGDVGFSYPTNWAIVPRQPPGVATTASGGAAVTVWAYESVAGVTDPTSTNLARKRLLSSLQRRAPSFKVTSSKVTQVAGSPAVEIRGSGEIAAEPVETRSVHVYKGGGEYVVDAYATPEDFARVDGEVFGPLLQSLVVNGRPPRPGQAPADAAQSPGAPATPAP